MRNPTYKLFRTAAVSSAVVFAAMSLGGADFSSPLAPVPATVSGEVEILSPVPHAQFQVVNDEVVGATEISIGRISARYRVNHVEGAGPSSGFFRSALKKGREGIDGAVADAIAQTIESDFLVDRLDLLTTSLEAFSSAVLGQAQQNLDEKYGWSPDGRIIQIEQVVLSDACKNLLDLTDPEVSTVVDSQCVDAATAQLQVELPSLSHMRLARRGKNPSQNVSSIPRIGP